MKRQAVGIRQVASAAAVSMTTVSHVLNDVPGTRVSDDTRARVLAAARDLDYVPNRLAQGLRTQHSGLIGLLSEEIATTPHAGQILKGAQEAASAAGYTLLTINIDQVDRSSQETALHALRKQWVDGVLIATMYHQVIDAARSMLPLVLIDAEDSRRRVPCAVPDEYGGALTAMHVLTDAGHRRIGFLTNTDDVPATRERLAAYRSVLEEIGSGLGDSLVRSDVSETEGGYRTALDLLSGTGVDRPTALFCYNDRMAWGAYQAAHELGLSIPQDLSIVGFDNQVLIAEGLRPSLTTVALPHYEMGRWAVEQLITMIDNPEAARATAPELLACPLVPRESVSALPA